VLFEESGRAHAGPASHCGGKSGGTPIYYAHLSETKLERLGELFPARPELGSFEQRDADLVVFCGTRLHAEPSIEFALASEVNQP
jgi:hypothetical protein